MMIGALKIDIVRKWIYHNSTLELEIFDEL